MYFIALCLGLVLKYYINIFDTKSHDVNRPKTSAFPVDRGAVITYVQCGRYPGVFTALSAVKCARTIN